MKEEQEQILKYIGELYAKRRVEKKAGKDITGPEKDDIITAGKRTRKVREKKE